MSISTEDYELAKERLAQIQERMGQFAERHQLWYGQHSFNAEYRELKAEREQLHGFVADYEAAQERAANPDPVIVRVP